MVLLLPILLLPPTPRLLPLAPHMLLTLVPSLLRSPPFALVISPLSCYWQSPPWHAPAFSSIPIHAPPKLLSPPYLLSLVPFRAPVSSQVSNACTPGSCTLPGACTLPGTYPSKVPVPPRLLHPPRLLCHAISMPISSCPLLGSCSLPDSCPISFLGPCQAVSYSQTQWKCGKGVSRETQPYNVPYIQTPAPFQVLVPSQVLVPCHAPATIGSCTLPVSCPFQAPVELSHTIRNIAPSHTS